MSLRCWLAFCALFTLLCFSAEAQTENSATKGAATPAGKEWIARSNENAQVLLKLQAKYAPEFASRQGLPGTRRLRSSRAQKRPSPNLNLPLSGS